MDSTTPDPQQTKQPQPPQPTSQSQHHQPHHQSKSQPQQQQQINQLQQLTPKIQQQQHQPQQQSHPTNMQPTMQQHQPSYVYDPHPSYMPYPATQPFYQPHQYGYHPGTPYYYTQTAQQMSMVSSPQATMPQTHPRTPAPLINRNSNTDRPHNHSGVHHGASLATGQQNKNPTKPAPSREKKIATLKDPNTLKEVPLTSATTKTSTTSSTSQKPSSVALSEAQTISKSADSTASSGATVSGSEAASGQTTNNKSSSNPTIATTKITSVEHELLQKVLDDGNNDDIKIKPKPDNDTNMETNVKPDTHTKLDTKSDIKADTTTNTDIKSETKPIPEATTTTTTKDTDADNETKLDSNVDKNSDVASNKTDIDTDNTFHPITNRGGRKRYSRQFLLDIGEKKCDIDLSHKTSDDKSYVNGDRHDTNLTRVDMFAPSFHTTQYTNRPNNFGGRSSQHNYGGRPSSDKPKKIIQASASLTQEVELKTVSNPWKPTKEVKEDKPDDVIESETVRKKFRSILNKLTPNNFENLAAAVTELNINTESKLGDVIDIVFAKALSEPGYCVLYGQMCSHLKKITAGSANFGNTLLKRCQHQFQADPYSGLNIKEREEKITEETDPEAKKLLEDELYEEKFRCRMRNLGLIKFIGELYKIDMLNDAIMHECIQRLIADTSEESLECLCDLLVTIGEKLDRSSQKNAESQKRPPKNQAPKPSAYQGGQKSAAAVVASGSASSQQQKQQQQRNVIRSLDPIFDSLHRIRKDKELELSVRIRFKILDTCELRERDNWQSKKTKDNNPKKIEEIREAHKEKLESEKRQNTVLGPRKSQEARGVLGRSGGSSVQLSSMANDSSRQSNIHTSSSSHVIRDYGHEEGESKSNNRELENHKRGLAAVKDFLGKQRDTSSAKITLEPSHLGGLRPKRDAKLDQGSQLCEQ